MRCFTHAHALVAVPTAIMIVCSLAAPVSVQADPLPGGDALLKQSVAAMRESLGAVHATGSDRWTAGQAQAKLRVAGDCVMQLDGIRSVFHSWGTRLTSAGTGKMVPVRYDRQFIVMLSSDSTTDRTWERNALTDKRWQQENSNNDALIVFSLCPATSQFGQALQGASPLQNLGAVTVGDTVTWHLRAKRTQTRNNNSARSQLDAYIDQKTHYFVKVKSDTIRRGKTVSRNTWARTFSQFNVPVDVEPPK